MSEILASDNLNHLCAKGIELGAARVRAFPARDVVVDERVRLKCLVPRCPYYGQPMCPPNVMPLDDFRRMLARYEHALLVQAEIGMSIEALREQYGHGLTLAELYATPGYKAAMRDSFRAFYETIGRLEAEAFSLGHRFAAGFAAGNHRAGLEDDGGHSRPEPPFTARPSVEAMGVDVFETARRAGLPITFPAEGTTAYYTGLILVC